MTTRTAITEGLDLTERIDRVKRRLDVGWLWFEGKDSDHPKWEAYTDRYLAEVKEYEHLVDLRNEITEALRG